MNNPFILDGGGRVYDNGQAVLLGLKDSMNPGGITGLLIFLVLLYWSFRLGIISMGATGSYITGVWSVTSAQSMGGFDFLFASRGYDIFLDIVYFFWACFSMILGSLFLKDWLFTVRDGDTHRVIIQLPFFKDQRVFSRSSLMGRKIKFRELPRRLLIYMGIFLLGAIVGLVEAAWAPDIFTGVLFYQFFTQGKFWLLAIVVFLYGGAYVLPRWIVWSVFWETIVSASMKARLCRSTTMMQIILAAVFLSYGFTIIFRYYILV
jgi:hypothetical protein